MTTNNNTIAVAMSGGVDSSTVAAMLKDRGMDAARRTVVKYREALGIGSSIQRRRLRKIAG